MDKTTATKITSEIDRAVHLQTAKRALEVIKGYARKYCMNPDAAPHSDARLIVSGIASLTSFDTDQCVEMAALLCEEVNYHDLASVIRETDGSWRSIIDYSVIQI